MVLASQKKTGSGRGVQGTVFPHPNLLPRGEGISGDVSVAVESGGHQSRRAYFHRRWERTSLTPRERARVRGNGALLTPKIVRITRSDHTVRLPCISTQHKRRGTLWSWRRPRCPSVVKANYPSRPASKSDAQRPNAQRRQSDLKPRLAALLAARDFPPHLPVQLD